MRSDRLKTVHRVADGEIGRAAEEIAGGWEKIHQAWSRRRFLKGALAAAGAGAVGSLALPGAGPQEALADKAVETGKFVFPRLQFSVYDGTPDIWNVGPSGDVILRKKLAELTNINVSMEPKVVRLGDFDEMCRYPLIFMTSEGYFRLPEKETKNLREYVERGGFLFADDCVYAAKEDRFFRCYRKLIDSLFPGNPMRHIPHDHEIYHIYFDFESAGSPHMQGVAVHDGKPGAGACSSPAPGGS